MKRDIKFRAWDNATNRMLETGFHVLGEVTCFGIIEQKLMEVPLGRTTLDRIGNVEIMQFVGFQDKNKKDCYEKDYDEDGNMVDFCERCFGYQFFQIDIPTKDVIFCHNCEGNFMLQDHIPYFEIIGNIYENP